MQVPQRWPSAQTPYGLPTATPEQSLASTRRDRLTAIPVGGSPSAIALDAGGVWVANRSDDKVVRIDPSTPAVTTTIPVGKAPAGITVSPGAVWVANSGDGTVSRIDPEINEVSETIEVGESPQSIIAANGRIWVTVQRQTIGSSGRKLRGNRPPEHGSSSIPWIRRSRTPSRHGSFSPPPARSSSTTRTSRLRPAPS